tara:strand:+ start:1807 stop:2457 length:651 start_codon:yes stop_codon:yes gene_type:complete
MSTKISKKRFKEILRHLIRKEIEEVSTTVTAGGSQGTGIYYDTPKAFSSGSKAHPKDGEVGGYKKVKEQVNEVMFAVKIDKGDGEVIQTIVNASSKSQAKARIARILKGGLKAVKDVQRVQPSLGKQIDKKLENVSEGKYHQWRNDETLTPKQKIGRSMREVKNALNSLSKQIDFNVRLKNELNVDSSSYWKTTHKALNQISERLVKLANKVGKLQ